jgi:uncharacterized membrane protein YvbJ
MPCTWWYTPSNENQKIFKDHCVTLVNYIKELEKDGDPVCCTLNDAVKLISHLYNPSSCEQKK